METLFGVPINQVMFVFLAVFLLGTLVVGAAALRNGVLFKMAFRNMPRRPGQTALILLGLMLATVLFSASFSTGDTMTHSLKVEATRALGEVDVVVEANEADVSGRLPYFDLALFESVRQALDNVPDVDGVQPLVKETVPVVSTRTGLSEPQVETLGLDPQWQAGFNQLEDQKGSPMSLEVLASGQVYISTKAADELEVAQGDTVQIFLPSRPAATLEVAGVYESGGNPAEEISMVIPLDEMQGLTGNEGMINSIAITNQGNETRGARYTDTVIQTLEQVLAGSSLEAKPVKQDAIDLANEEGATFSSVFLVFAQFSIIAGILLIFLIFIMLAAERKRELGIARAVGTQRSQVIFLFAFEGAIYALIASLLGSLLGLGVGFGMANIMSIALADIELDISYSFNWRSVIIAFTMGVAFTFAVVLVSSWRASRLNIVRAIKDLPEPRAQGRDGKGLLLAVALPLLGVLLTFVGLQGEQQSSFMLGTSLIIIGIPLLARRLGFPDRPAYTLAGLALVVWWLMPFDLVSGLLPEMESGIEMFFLSGIMIVFGAVWVVIYNSDLLTRGVMALLGHIPGLLSVLKTSVSYAMQNRFRTGMALAMFSLVIFTLMVMAFITAAISNLWNDTEMMSGGFDIRADISYANPITDMREAVESSGAFNPQDFEAFGGMVVAPMEMKQADTSQEFEDVQLEAVDQEYSQNITYDLAMMAPEYRSAREVWAALQSNPDTAIVSPALVPAKVNYSVGAPAPPIRLEGFWIEDEVLPEVYIQVRDPRTGDERNLRVIGVVEQTAVYIGFVITSLDSMSGLAQTDIPAQSYVVRLADGVDTESVARSLESTFVGNGMQAVVIEEEIRDLTQANVMINSILQGFMGLGLVVGIAALGVIAARSVVERRKQIGVLRALGFQKEMVQLSFLLESSFVALVGIAIGMVLGFALSFNLTNEMSDMLGRDVGFSVPWVNVLAVVIIAYGASLVTTFLPARQASRVYPAEALRYE
jgi:putative ABC transport system permease protein